MDSSWNWPGARWWRCDLHLHSPASHDYPEKQDTPEQWVERALSVGLEAVAVTDHNTGGWVDELRVAAAARGLPLFAGVEVTSDDGIHVLALLDETSGKEDVGHLLTLLDVDPSERGREGARSTKHVLELVRTAASHGWLCIAAHADATPHGRNPSTASLMTGLASRTGRLKEVLDDPGLAAAEILEDDTDRHAELHGVGRPGRSRRAPGLALIQSSDAHALDEIGRRSTWVKMTKPTREGLELALSDGLRSVRLNAVTACSPNRPPALAIASLTIDKLKHAGRPTPLTVEFSPWLTVIVGGRGAGKSTVVNALRIALRRDVDAEGEIAASLRTFARVGVRGEAGALEPDTRLEVEYERDGHRLRAAWSQDGTAPALQETSPTGEWQPADGDVRLRLPARVLGQDELNALAEQPRRILALSDETPAVDRREWQERWDVEHTRFLSLRAQGRQTASKLPDVSQLRGELADVERGLAVLEAPEHRETLQRLQLVRRQQQALRRWQESLDVMTEALASSVTRVAVDDPPVDRFAAPGDELVRETLTAYAGAVTGLLRDAVAAAEAVKTRVHAGPDPAAMAAWQSRVATAERAYEALGAELAAAGGIDPARYGELVARRQEIESRLAAVERTREAVAALARQADESLRRLALLRAELSERRRRFFEEVSAGSTLVRFALVGIADRSSAAAELRELLLGDAGATTFTTVVDDCVDGLAGADDRDADPQRLLTALKARLRAGADGHESGLDGRFAARLARLVPETLDRLDAWFPDDRLELSYLAGDRWRPMAQGSKGQQNAAILAFLLAYGEEPLIIDQPENDLDNALISDLVVQQLRATKKHRQLIIVTHNPNIVVNADADYVVALSFEGGQVRVTQAGGLQEQAIRDEVCKIVEGGREAFESRYSRIGDHHVRRTG